MQSAHTYRENSNVVPAEFSLNRPPPHAVGDQQDPASDLLGRFVWLCFSLAVDEKIRLGLIERWKENYRLYRGDHWNTIKTKANRHQVTINLYFANVLRTVANITAKSPSVEILDLDGVNDGADRLFTAKQKKWWSETEQQSGIAFSTLNNEINGITFEKARWDGVNDSPGFSVLDPHTCFPAPGLFENCQKMPYFCHAYIMNIDDVITKYKIEDESTISPDNFDDLLGKGREGVKPTLPGSESELGSGGYSNNSPTQTSIEAGVSGKGNVLVVEMWYKDKTDPIKYPDGIRVTTVTNCGKLVLKDSANPNINPGSENQRDVSNTFAYGKIPFYFVTSYEDITSIWGFSAAEQTGELNKKIDELVSRLLQYAQRAMLPPLVVESGCGISRSQINNKPGLVLMPRRANARIEFLRVPELPQSFFKVLDILVGFHDRVYQIEDADRGVQPTGVTAASAIVALQERNSVLMAHKIMSIDKLVRQRGRWALSMWQNFSVVNESVEVNGEQQHFRGIDFAERRFNYLVESGSTVARTSLREEEQATQLYKLGVIDRQALLETLNFKDWKAIVERVGEGQLDQALQILVQAGLPEEEAGELRQALMQTQHGGDTALNSSEPKPGTPKAQQGGV